MTTHTTSEEKAMTTTSGGSGGKTARWLAAAAVAAAAMGAQAREAAAFCGFYVNGAGGPMYNDATQVVLMRMGTRTVLSMRNHYQGPTEGFAMVVPVPVVLKEGDVKTLPAEVFAKVDGMGAPRLVEYWEQDPCAPEPSYDRRRGVPAPSTMTAEGAGTGRAAGYGVTIEAKFAVGEYEVVILSATDSTGLDGWLRAEKYAIPSGAEPLLRPYVEGGSKFFVAKVDPTKVKTENGRVVLSPLRFHYDSEEFALPIRLGLANSSGKQDLIVSVVSPEGRYEVANYGNVTIPTNLEVRDEVRDRFGEFYAALFDRTLEKHPGAVVTEYAWDASSCDPCPGPTLDGGDFMTLGADVLGGGAGKAEPYQGWGYVLTRLHARYGATDMKEDLVFRKAGGIVGGREFVVDAATQKLEEGAQPSGMNNFQGRYAIRHAWTGPVECASPVRGRWGGPPAGERYAGVQGARDLAFAPRGQAALATMVAKDVPELGVKAASATPAAGSKPAGTPTTAPKAGPAKGAEGGGCGCATSGGGEGVGGGALLGAAALLAARRRRR